MAVPPSQLQLLDAGFGAATDPVTSGATDALGRAGLGAGLGLE
jgi:hypothetical protein